MQNQIPTKFKEKFYLYIAMHCPCLIDRFDEKYKTAEMYKTAIIGYRSEHILSISFEKHPE